MKWHHTDKICNIYVVKRGLMGCHGDEYTLT